MIDKKDIKRGISLCVIVKNEEKMIRRTIASVRDIVNEIIVVDTGSNDKTCERARSVGAKIFHFNWCDDFSQARNFSLQQASYEWILVLDADEVIAKRDLGRLPQIVKDNNCEAVVLSQRNYCNSPDTEGWRASVSEYKEGDGYLGFFDVPVIRLFRNNGRIYFRGLVHEVVDQTTKGLKKRYLDVQIHHYSRYEDKEQRERKSFFLSFFIIKTIRA